MTNTIAKSAINAAPTVSPKYSFIQTERVYELLADYGFREDKYRQSRERNPERQGYQKHISILQRDVDCDEQGGFNLLLVNSHDGSSSLHLETGYFRILCENQLGHGDVGIRVRHTGDVLSKLERAIPQVLGQMDDFKVLQALLRDRMLTPDQLRVLVGKALELRGLPVTEHNVSRLQTTRRNEGAIRAWEQFNIIQENMVRGGFRIHAEDKDGLCVFRKLRALTSADRLLDANRELTATVKQLIAA